MPEVDNLRRTGAARRLWRRLPNQDRMAPTRIAEPTLKVPHVGNETGLSRRDSAAQRTCRFCRVPFHVVAFRFRWFGLLGPDFGVAPTGCAAAILRRSFPTSRTPGSGRSSRDIVLDRACPVSKCRSPCRKAFRRQQSTRPEYVFRRA